MSYIPGDERYDDLYFEAMEPEVTCNRCRIAAPLDGYDNCGRCQVIIDREELEEVP